MIFKNKKNPQISHLQDFDQFCISPLTAAYCKRKFL